MANFWINDLSELSDVEIAECIFRNYQVMNIDGQVFREREFFSRTGYPWMIISSKCQEVSIGNSESEKRVNDQSTLAVVMDWRLEHHEFWTIQRTSNKKLGAYRPFGSLYLHLGNSHWDKIRTEGRSACRNWIKIADSGHKIKTLFFFWL